MIRTIIHPSGAVLDLPADTLCTYAPRALDGIVGLAVETWRCGDNGKRVASEWGEGWDHEFVLEYPTSLRARRVAEAESRAGYGFSLPEVDDRGIHLECELRSMSLGERCMVFLGERDPRGRRLWRLARREIPRAILDECERLLVEVTLHKAKEAFDDGMREAGLLGWALRIAIVQVERANIDASKLIAMRAQCHKLVGHDFGA